MYEIRFLSPLYTGKKLKELGKRKWHIAHRSTKMKTVCIMLSPNDDEMLYYESTDQLFGRFSKKTDLDVVGLASDKDEAKSLVFDIVEDCLKSRGDVDIKAYFNAEALIGSSL